MKVYIAFEYGPFISPTQVQKVFDTEDKAKSWTKDKNANTFQEFDDYGLTDGHAYDYFEMEVE